MSQPKFSAADVIARKQAGKRLSTDEIDWFVKASTDGRVPDYQLSAFLMAVFFRGMNLRETRDLTAAMMETGRRLELRSIRATKVDKHSTGGVGDKISLILGPLVASVGVRIPMVSGRGLGHTGGTLDKLESIPGFRTSLDALAFEHVVSKVGISIIGQTDEIAPADRKFYAIRDVTSTIACQPLMVASILSKKIASGADAVVFDIKCGRGAFMKRMTDARSLAGLLSKVASMLGVKASAVITRMDEPLGRCVGNALEIREVIEVLKGCWIEDLTDVTLALGSEMVLLAGRARRRQEAYRLLKTALLGGKALQKFKDLIKAQGGDARIVDAPDRLTKARHVLNVKAQKKGYVSEIDALEVGRIAALLGAGRFTTDSRIDHSVGVEFRKKSRDQVAKGEVMALVHASDISTGRRCADLLRAAMSISKARPRAQRVVVGRVTSSGIRPMPVL
jgi:pyrimidine-nucleoside phosphorylase